MSRAGSHFFSQSRPGQQAAPVFPAPPPAVRGRGESFQGSPANIPWRGASPFHWLDGQKLAVVKAEFAALERDKIIWWSSSPWVSPLHMVKKPDGYWRCGDYRRLINVTVPDTYPLPNMMDFSSRVAGCSIFSKIDFRKGSIKFLCTLLTS
jgi:hypothetical protein